MDDLLQEFIAETRETLEALAGEIVAWEAAPGDRARLDAIFRFVHTVKGSCGFLDLPRLARLSHAAEDVLASVRDGKRTPGTALVNAVLAIVDRIGEIVEAIDAGSALDDSGEDLLIAALDEDALSVKAVPVGVQQRSANRTVRLSVDLLDRMMGGMSEMVLARNELARRLRYEGVDPKVDMALERLSATVAEMRDTVTRTRMQKIDALFSALPRMVRDTAAMLDKQVRLTIDGADVELDREMIELMRDPLVHIIRNAVDHGIEPKAVRAALRKPEVGHLSIAARQSGNQILIEIVDDGAGIDVARVVAKAEACGLHSTAALAQMGEAERLDLIFHPGLSSRDTVSEISGRGVGMDVVRANLEQIGGRIALANRPGRGLAITIQVPLTLSIISTIIVGVGYHRFALARQSIEEIVALRGDAVRIDQVGGAAMATVRGRRLPMLHLATLLGVAPVREADAATVLAIVATRDGDYALAVDAVIDAEELVVKPAAPAVMATGLYAGQTLPDSGLPLLLLDGAGLAIAAGVTFGAAGDEAATIESATDPAVAALLFDDLDGVRRGLALAAIDRVETVACAQVHHSGGRLRLSVDGRLIPLHAEAGIGDRDTIAVLRLTDGEREFGYAIREAIEIVPLPVDLTPVSGDDRLAGVAMIAGKPVEILDPLTLFAAEPAGGPERALCLLRVDPGGWMETFLKPALEASGYRCVTRLAAGERADVALAMEDDPSEPGCDTPSVRLRRAADAPRGDASVYRYDRAGVIAAVAERVARGASA